MVEPVSAPEWRIVQHYTDYEVSSDGIVRRAVDHHRSPRRWPAGSVISPVLTGDKYRRHKDDVESDFRYVSVWLHSREDGKRRLLHVNRLVCRAFHGDPPDESYEAAHCDGDRRNNREENLRWATPASNQADRVSHKTDSRGDKHGRAKLTETTVVEILQRLADGERQADLGREYGVPACTIDHLKHGRTWRHVPRPHPLQPCRK
jgi:hypothetical protein